jgi:hypothetical protein
MSIHRVTVSGLLWGSIVQNVLHFDNPEGTLTLAQIATEIYDNFLGHTALVGYQHITGNVVTYFSIKVETLQASPPSPYTYNFTRAGEVSAGNDVMPQVCLVVQIRTALAGRKNHGRFYVPGFPTSFATQGIINTNATSYIVQCLPAMEARFKTTGSGPLILGVLPRHSTTGDGFVHMTGLQVSAKPGIQRRRGVGIGI